MKNIKQNYDVIVLGGGPGGSMVATLLADYGKSVLIIEKENFPRYHIGESLLSGTAALMEKIGVLDKVENGGYIKKWGVEWLWGKEEKSWTVYFKDALAMPHDYGFQVERAEFDKMLLDNAKEHGVDVLQPCLAANFLEEDERIVGVIAKHVESNEVYEIGSKFVVDATGQGGLLTKRKNQQSWDKKLQNMAVWSYWKNAKRGEGIDEGNTFLPTFNEGWWWFIPLQNDIVSIGAIIDRDNFDKVKESGYEDYYKKAIQDTPALKERLVNAEMCDEVRVQRDWSYKFDKFYGKGFIAIGDAACFIDPLFSTGVHLAMLSGYMASVTINTILDQPEIDETELLEFYQSKYEAEYSRLRAQVYFLYGGHESDKSSYFWNARKQFDVPGVDPQKAFISLIAGAYEHRSWYNRYLKQLEVPQHLRDVFEGRFTHEYSGADIIDKNAPLNFGKNWKIADDFAIDGAYLLRTKVLLFTDGTSLPYDNYYQLIIESVNGELNYNQLLAILIQEDGLDNAIAESCIEKAITYGALIFEKNNSTQADKNAETVSYDQQ